MDNQLTQNDKDIAKRAIYIYLAGVVWWAWGLAQPFDDKGIITLSLTAFFYGILTYHLLKTQHKLLLLALTMPIIAAVSLIVVGIISYAINATGP